MKYLVVNSDDFGVCHSVNTGTLRAFREGILTQASLMVPTPWFEEAVALAKEHRLPCGVHLTATCEWDLYRWRPLTHVKSFVEKDGTLAKSIQRVRRGGDRRELEREFAAQIELAISRGIKPTHLDSHMWVMDSRVLIRLCRKYGILTHNTGANDVERLEPDVVFPLAGEARCFSNFDDTNRKKTEFRKWLEGLCDGWHLAIVHVGEAGEELASMASQTHPLSNWTQPYRVTDMELICDPEVRRWIDALGIQLANFGDYAGALPPSATRPPDSLRQRPTTSTQVAGQDAPPSSRGGTGPKSAAGMVLGNLWSFLRRR